MSTSGMHRRPFEGRHLVIFVHNLINRDLILTSTEY